MSESGTPGASGPVGIVGYGAYVPWWRLQRSAIGAAHGGSAGKGTRSVASYNQDTTAMAVEAARNALRPLGDGARAVIGQVLFATTAPSYADKTNATTVHAALRLDRDAAAFDLNGAVRSGAGALALALGPAAAGTTSLVAVADQRTGLPNSADEREGGDAAAALLVGPDTPGRPLLAELIGRASVSEEFVDRWRVPGDARSRQWEERFGETRYGPLGAEAAKAALEAAGLGAEGVHTVVVAGPHARAVKQVGGKVSAGTVHGLADDLSATVGNAGAAQLALVLAAVLDAAEPGQVILALSLADGADAFVFRATDAIAAHQPSPSVAAQIAAGNADPGLPYLKFLSWTGQATVQPPNRPEPARVSASAAARNEEWKYGLVRDHEALAEASGTIVTFTVDRLAYSPSPPVVFAVVDFDEGGRMPVELTDVDAAAVAIGQRVAMTFRRLNQSDGIQNYFWKATPIR